jgi:hypothetical protein
LSVNQGGEGSGGGGTGGEGTGGGNDNPPPTNECDDLELQAQLVEPFTLYQAVMPRVVVEYDDYGRMA